MINITTKELEIKSELKKKIEFMCYFCNMKPTIINKNNFTISNENINKIKKYDIICELYDEDIFDNDKFRYYTK
jgi:hypothetical protein